MSAPTPEQVQEDLISSLHVIVRQRDEARAQVSALQAVLIKVDTLLADPAGSPLDAINFSRAAIREVLAR